VRSSSDVHSLVAHVLDDCQHTEPHANEQVNVAMAQIVHAYVLHVDILASTFLLMAQVVLGRLSSGPRSARMAMKSAISSRRNFGICTLRTEFGVFGGVITSRLCRRWYDLVMEGVESARSKSPGVNANSSP
jgi:hypothetical protein